MNDPKLKKSKTSLTDVRDAVWRSVWMHVRRLKHLLETLNNSADPMPPDFARLPFDDVRNVQAEAFDDILILLESAEWAAEK